MNKVMIFSENLRSLSFIGHLPQWLDYTLLFILIKLIDRNDVFENFRRFLGLVWDETAVGQNLEAFLLCLSRKWMWYQVSCGKSFVIDGGTRAKFLFIGERSHIT